MYITSLPYLWYPKACNYAAMTDIYWPQKGVASPDVPSRADFLESKHSTRWPIVILDGIAWGLTIKSGTIPSLVNGRSSYL